MTDIAFHIVLFLCAVIALMGGYFHWLLDPKHPERIERARDWWWGPRKKTQRRPELLLDLVSDEDLVERPLTVYLRHENVPHPIPVRLKPHLNEETRN